MGPQTVPSESVLFARRIKIAVGCLILALGPVFEAVREHELAFLMPAFLLIVTAWAVSRLAIEGGAFAANARLRALCDRWSEAHQTLKRWGFGIALVTGLGAAVAVVLFPRTRPEGQRPIAPILVILGDAFHEGGWGMWPILVLLMITMWILIDRAVYLRRSVIDVDKVMSLLKSQIVSGNIQGAVNTCQSSPAPVTKIIAAGLRKAGGTESEVQQAMDEEALRELPHLEARTGYLAMLGNLATLAGLLGTITGLIKAFAGVAGIDPSEKAKLLSKGISEALNCTFFGLTTGIIGLAAFAFLNGRTQKAVDDIAGAKKNVSAMLFGARVPIGG